MGSRFPAPEQIGIGLSYSEVGDNNAPVQWLLSQAEARPMAQRERERESQQLKGIDCKIWNADWHCRIFGSKVPSLFSSLSDNELKIFQFQNTTSSHLFRQAEIYWRNHNICSTLEIEIISYSLPSFICVSLNFSLNRYNTTWNTTIYWTKFTVLPPCFKQKICKVLSLF